MGVSDPWIATEPRPRGTPSVALPEWLQAAAYRGMVPGMRGSFPGWQTGLASVALLIAGCGTYQRDFQQAEAVREKPAVSVEGPWRGEWRSEVNGHHGPLWCLIEREDEAHHRFRYRAGWGAMSFGDYTHRAATQPDGRGGIRLAGEMELPGGFGTYTVEGRVTPERFEARYRSKGDRGVMSLRRPE